MVSKFRSGLKPIDIMSKCRSCLKPIDMVSNAVEYADFKTILHAWFLYVIEYAKLEQPIGMISTFCMRSYPPLFTIQPQVFITTY